MAQAFSPWQQFLQSLGNLSLSPSQVQSIDVPILSRLKGSPSWTIGTVAIVVLLLWDWKLLVSIGAGSVVLGVAYAMQQWDWGGFQDVVRQFFASPNRPLAVAVASGGLSALAIYVAASIWTTVDNPWIAALAIVQGMATMAILAILLGQNLSGLLKSEENTNLYDKLDGLTDADPLKRLIAVRQILRWVKNRKIEKTDRRTVDEAFRLMLQSETESIVLEAVLEGLQELDETKKIAFPTPAITLAQSSSSPAKPKPQPLSPALQKQQVRVSS
ncbi:MAG: hypothetical protein WBG66_05920 [Geitlerinemataceae cyanobacterium]